MANQYKNKVVYNGTTLIDLSDTTAVQSDVASGKYFYTASGERVAGTGQGTGNVNDVQINGTSIITDGVANIPYAAYNKIGVVQVNENRGTYMLGSTLCVSAADSSLIKTGTHINRPIVPNTQHESTFYGLAKASGDSTQSASSNAVGTYTDEAKASIQTMLGINNIEDRIDIIKDKYWYAGAIDSTNTGFVSTDGAIIGTNTNYKYIKYTPKDEAIKIKVDSLYINGSGSSYAVFAFYKSDNTFIKAISNTDINTETSQSLFNNVEATIPKGTAYILITFGNMSSSTNFSTITEYGIYVPETKLKLFNIPVSGDWAQQFYFHIATSELGDYSSLYFNAKFETNEPVLKYDIYFTGYEENYNGRAFAVYHTNLTKGINGNEVTISENFQNTANSIRAKYWTGVIVNLYYAQPTAGASSIRLLNKYSIISNYCTLNDQQIDLVQYPGSSYRAIDNEYKKSYNPLQGGYLCVIGDSLSGAYYKTEQETWVYLISKWNSMRYDNFSISGNPIAKTSEYTENECIAERVDDLVARNYTHIILMGGANDFNYLIPIGENSDTEITTFKGALNHIIDTLITKFPQAKIVFATTYRRNIDYLDKPYADAMIEICKLHSIPCLNNYDSSGVHFFNSAWMSYFGATNALGNNHLNAAGDLYVAPRFEQFLKYSTVNTTDNIPVNNVQINGTSIVENGIAEIPFATSSIAGVVKTDSDWGIGIYDPAWSGGSYGNFLYISPASSAQIKAGSTSYKAIVPNTQHESIFYGLAKASGDTTQASSSNAIGTYTESAKSSISEMLNGSIAVSGTTPTIIAKAGIRYVCGEVLTLDITVPSTGIIDVIFTSGSSPTVLTITPPTGMTMKWANNFDPAILEANATYEINIMDGYLGVVGKWT